MLAGRVATGVSAVRNEASGANSLQIGFQRIVFLDHSPSHQTTLVLGNDHLVGSRSTYGVGISLLSGSGDNFYVRIEGSRGHGDVQIVRVVIDHNTDAHRPLNSGGLQHVVTFGISLYYHQPIFQQFAIQTFVGLNQHKRNLNATQLIDHGTSDLAVSTNNEVAFHLLQADFIHHRFPNLRSMPAENGDGNPLRNPDLKGKHTHENEEREKLGGVVHAMVIDGVRIQYPKSSILPSQFFKPHVHADAYQTESREEQERQPQAPNKHE